MNKKATIIAAFAGSGKSYLAEKYHGVLDLESSYFKWENKGLEHLSVEERKGITTRVLNREWPNNYIKEIVAQQDSYDIIFIILPHALLKTEKIADYFFENNIDFYIARPKITALETIVKRLKARGNNEDFINQVKNNFPVFIEEFSKPKYKSIVINNDEYLEDALLRLGFLKPKIK
ncbi:hypothetical protein KC939_00420 [Candidatus Saccharibacteria bacterium]|nr:hypothetical protein [Candidatus Saccharibacteria bacterium]